MPYVLEHERTWGFVETIASAAIAIERKLRGETYQTKTLGERFEPPVRLVGARLDPERDLAIELEGERETPDTADVFRELHMARSRQPTEPLFRGQWRRGAAER